MFNQIYILKASLEQHSRLVSVLISNLCEILIIIWICHSNAIAGNILILKETNTARYTAGSIAHQSWVGHIEI